LYLILILLTLIINLYYIHYKANAGIIVYSFINYYSYKVRWGLSHLKDWIEGKRPRKSMSDINILMKRIDMSGGVGCKGPAAREIICACGIYW